MNWISAVGYAMFPFRRWKCRGVQDVMHIYVVTVLVVLFDSLPVVIMVGGYKDRRYKMPNWATVTLMMFGGAIGTGLATAYFGILSVLAFSLQLDLMQYSACIYSKDFGNQCRTKPVTCRSVISKR